MLLLLRQGFSVQPLLAWDSQRPARLCLLSAGDKIVHHLAGSYFSRLFHFVNMEGFIMCVSSLTYTVAMLTPLYCSRFSIYTAEASEHCLVLRQSLMYLGLAPNSISSSTS